MRDQPILEWTIDVETPEGINVDLDRFEAFADAIVTDERALGAAPALFPERGVVSAVFQVVAESEFEAAHTAHEVFSAALETSGLRGEIVESARLGTVSYDVLRPVGRITITLENETSEVLAR